MTDSETSQLFWWVAEVELDEHGLRRSFVRRGRDRAAAVAWIVDLYAESEPPEVSEWIKERASYYHLTWKRRRHYRGHYVFEGREASFELPEPDTPFLAEWLQYSERDRCGCRVMSCPCTGYGMSPCEHAGCSLRLWQSS